MLFVINHSFNVLFSRIDRFSFFFVCIHKIVTAFNVILNIFSAYGYIFIGQWSYFFNKNINLHVCVINIIASRAVYIGDDRRVIFIDYCIYIIYAFFCVIMNVLYIADKVIVAVICIDVKNTNLRKAFKKYIISNGNGSQFFSVNIFFLNFYLFLYSKISGGTTYKSKESTDDASHQNFASDNPAPQPFKGAVWCIGDVESDSGKRQQRQQEAERYKGEFYSRVQTHTFHAACGIAFRQAPMVAA